MNIMKDVSIQPFSQFVWNSEKYRADWADALAIIKNEVWELEIKSVIAGLRPCAWQTIDEYDLPGLVARMARVGLIVLPVMYTGKWEGYAHRTIQLQPGQPKNVYCIIAQRKEDAFGFRQAYEAGDMDAQGRFLGYPECCRKWFAEQYSGGNADPVWQAVRECEQDGNHKKISIKKIHPYSNPLIRYAGVRVSFHIPCSFYCKPTVEIADKQLNLINLVHRKLITALLSMSVDWSILHGIGVLETPLFLMTFNAVPTAEKYSIRIDGGYEPKEGTKWKE